MIRNAVVVDNTGSLTACLLHTKQEAPDTSRALNLYRLPMEQSPGVSSPAKMTATIHVTTPSTHNPRGRLGWKLLSPNVCTERGPAKSHSSRATEVMVGSLSTTLRLPLRFQRPQRKEKVAFSSRRSDGPNQTALRNCATAPHYNI